VSRSRYKLSVSGCVTLAEKRITANNRDRKTAAALAQLVCLVGMRSKPVSDRHLKGAEPQIMWI